jgi:F-type H+-transporting ATPase subunit alpha
MTGKLKLAYSQFEELESFSRFGTRLDENTRKIIDHGNRIRTCFKQKELHPLSVTEQIMVLTALSNGLFDNIAIDKVEEAEAALIKSCTTIPTEILKRMLTEKDFAKADSEAISKIADEILVPFRKKPDADKNKK